MGADDGGAVRRPPPWLRLPMAPWPLRTGRAGRGGLSITWARSTSSACGRWIASGLWATPMARRSSTIRTYRTGFFLGAPSRRPREILFPASAPSGPSFAVGAPASSSDTPSPFLAEGGMWREALAVLSGGHTIGHDGGHHRATRGSPVLPRTHPTRGTRSHFRVRTGTGSVRMFGKHIGGPLWGRPRTRDPPS